LHLRQPRRQPQQNIAGIQRLNLQRRLSGQSLGMVRVILAKYCDNSAIQQIENQLCSVRKTHAPFCSLSHCEARAGRESERGEIDKKRLLSPALFSFFEEERERKRDARSKQIFCRTQQIENLHSGSEPTAG
jgi:hypothetical protein